MLDEKSIEIYSSRDKIREQLINLAKNYLQLENFDFSKSSYLSYIINMLSMLDANLMYYISSVYREQFLTKAIQRESVLNLANIIGYKPLLAKPATCSILIEVPYVKSGEEQVIQLVGRNDNSFSSDVGEVPIFKVYSTDNIEFTLIDTIVVDISANGSVSVNQQIYINSSNTSNTGWKKIEYRFVNNKIQFFANFVQLIEYVETFTIPELLPNEFYNIPVNFPKNGSLADVNLFAIETTTNGVIERWSQKDSIFGIGPREASFTYRESEKGIIVSFGNGVIGRQPKRGTNVVVTIGLTRGYKGNVIAGSIKRADAARALVRKADGSIQYNYIQLKVINKEPSQFGQNAPTIDEIRSKAINSVSANSRLVSERDFQNADLVVRNLPIRNVFQVLKRSDLKRNEITLFTELIYNNVVVPTRNSKLEINKNLFDENTYEYLIKAEQTELEIDNEQYITLFDILVNHNSREAQYLYHINETQKPVSIYSVEKTLEPTKILPIFTFFNSDRTSNPEELIVQLHCNLIDDTVNYRCKMNVDWPSINGTSTYVLYDNTSLIPETITSIKIFSTQPDEDDALQENLPILLETVPIGDTVEFEFIIEYENKFVAGDWIELNRSRSSVVLKKDLSDFMYSQVNYNIDDDSNDNVVIYDVPVIKKDFYENLINRSLFTSSVLQKIVEFNVYEYKMLTDYVNLKFANTTGYSTNMKYRNSDRAPVLDINPKININLKPDVGTRYAVSDEKNPWSESNNYVDITGGGFIAFANPNRTSAPWWSFEKLKVNDMFDVTRLTSTKGAIFSTPDETTVKMIYTGKEIVIPKFYIPINIRMVVIPSEASTVTDQVLIKNIKDTLVTKLSPMFGYNKSLLRSVIIKIVQEVPGVEHIELLEPKFNIKFESDPYKNMTQEELLRYTPELVFFSTENIYIDLKD